MKQNILYFEIWFKYIIKKQKNKTQVQWQKFTEEGTITYHNLANETDKHTAF